MPLLGLAVQNALPERLLGVASSSSQFFREIGGTLGIALSGTLVTAQLRNDLLGRLPPEVPAHVPADTLSRVEDPRILLSPEALGQLRGAFAALGPDGLALYTTTVNAMRGVLADGLHDVFLVGTVIALFVLAVSVFLPELPLRSAKPVLAYRPAWSGTNGRRAAVRIPSLAVSRRAMPTSVPVVWRLNGYWKRRPCRPPVVAVHYRRREDGRP